MLRPPVHRRLHLIDDVVHVGEHSVGIGNSSHVASRDAEDPCAVPSQRNSYAGSLRFRCGRSISIFAAIFDAPRPLQFDIDCHIFDQLERITVTDTDAHLMHRVRRNKYELIARRRR